MIRDLARLRVCHRPVSQEFAEEAAVQIGMNPGAALDLPAEYRIKQFHIRLVGKDNNDIPVAVVPAVPLARLPKRSTSTGL